MKKRIFGILIALGIFLLMHATVFAYLSDGG